MTGEQRLHGVSGAGGTAIGPAYLLTDVAPPPGGSGGPAEQARARAALQAIADRLGAASTRLAAAGRTDEAEILAASQLMAEDPALLAEVEALTASRPATAALLEAVERQAALLTAIPDPYLAARAADIRRLGMQAARLAANAAAMNQSATDVERRADIEGAMNCVPTERSDLVGAQFIAPTRFSPSLAHGEGVGGEVAPVILVARDLGPADLAEVELNGLVVGGAALAEGSVTSHAAIVARSLGVPLVVGLGETLLALEDGVLVVLDGRAGTLVVGPDEPTTRQARAAVDRERQRRAQLTQGRRAGAVTSDGHPIHLLVNIGSERDVLAGLAAGAEGVGLLRTELAFLGAPAWPDEAQHMAALRPILRHLGGRPSTVRTLDFGADKTPPFLRDRSERGIALQLREPDALEAQLRALLRAGADASLRIMLPLVEEAAQLEDARNGLRAAHRAVAPHAPPPPLGAMIETSRAIQQIDAIAAASDFLSIGTNDLVQALLGLDRLGPAATVRAAGDPRILRAIRAVVHAARLHGLTAEVCGEAAGDPRIAILLVGLGVSELSVAPFGLDEVRAAVRTASLSRATEIAESALRLDSAEAVLALLDAKLAGRPGLSSG